MKQNELDKFIQGKLEEQSFDYNPADWENALKLIEKEDKKRRVLWIWWVAAGFILAIGAHLYLKSAEVAPTVDQLESKANTEISTTPDTKGLAQQTETDTKSNEEEVQLERIERRAEICACVNSSERGHRGRLSDV